MLTPKPTAGDTAWFVHDRFGMFIHWGLYSLPARHEWLMTSEKIDPTLYAERYRPRFTEPAVFIYGCAVQRMDVFLEFAEHVIIRDMDNTVQLSKVQQLVLN